MGIGTHLICVFRFAYLHCLLRDVQLYPVHPRAPVLLVALLQREGVHDELRVGLGVVREEGRKVDGPRIVGVARRLLAVDLAVVAQSVDVLKGVRGRLADLGDRFSETEITK